MVKLKRTDEELLAGLHLIILTMYDAEMKNSLKMNQELAKLEGGLEDNPGHRAALTHKISMSMAESICCHVLLTMMQGQWDTELAILKETVGVREVNGHPVFSMDINGNEEAIEMVTGKLVKMRVGALGHYIDHMGIKEEEGE